MKKDDNQHSLVVAGWERQTTIQPCRLIRPWREKGKRTRQTCLTEGFCSFSILPPALDSLAKASVQNQLILFINSTVYGCRLNQPTSVSITSETWIESIFQVLPSRDNKSENNNVITDIYRLLLLPPFLTTFPSCTLDSFLSRVFLGFPTLPHAVASFNVYESINQTTSNNKNAFLARDTICDIRN